MAGVGDWYLDQKRVRSLVVCVCVWVCVCGWKERTEKPRGRNLDFCVCVKDDL